MAEAAAWKFVEEKGIDMVSINPAIVIGPFVQQSLNYGASVILGLINGLKSEPINFLLISGFQYSFTHMHICISVSFFHNNYRAG